MARRAVRGGSRHPGLEGCRGRCVGHAHLDGPGNALVEASRRDEELRQAAENKRKRLLRALRVSVAGLAVLASLAAVMATIEKRQAVEATRTARTKAENTARPPGTWLRPPNMRPSQKNEAKRQKNEAEYQAKLARASSLDAGRSPSQSAA